MAPFAGDGIGAGPHLRMAYDAASDAGAEDDAEDKPGALAGAIDCFG